MRADELLGLEVGDDPTRTSYELSPHLCRLDGNLYGGTGLGAALAAFEAATGRPALWATTQFVATTRMGARIDQQVDVLAEGRNVAQVRLTASAGDQLLYTAVGSTARPRTGAIAEVAGTGPVMPDVDPPTAPFRSAWHAEVEVGFPLVADYLDLAHPPDPATGDRVPGRVAMWARIRGETRNTPATLAFLADAVPLGICNAAGVAGAGTSLDNTLRVGHLVDSEWVLLDIHGTLAHDGYGHGHVHVWSTDGVLLATGSQSSPLLVLPPDWVGPGRRPPADG